MVTVVFVHGTGVRQPAFGVLFERVRQQLCLHWSNVEMVPCYWGAEAGARLNMAGASIPTYDSARAVIDEEDEHAVWRLLYDDPLFELGLLADASHGAIGLGDDAGEELGERLRDFLLGAELALLLERAHLTGQMEPARRAILESSELGVVLSRAHEPLAELRTAIARALVAEMLSLQRTGDVGADATPVWSIDGELRDRVVRLIVEKLGGSDRSIGGWIGGKLARLGARWATSKGRRERGAISDAAYPVAGDVVLYQSRGELIRSCIRTTIEAARSPVVVLAHSLGGIACVEMLAERNLPQVRLLLTAGSQAPFLYEIDALGSLRLGTPLPEHFPRWLNVYDLSDFLSYVAAPVFGNGKVRDVRLDSGEPFPSSHSAYWTNPRLWNAVAEEWPDC